MSEENLEDTILPSASVPIGQASSGGQRLRPKILRDRPVIDPVPGEYVDPDPEVADRKIQNQFRAAEAMSGTPAAHKPFYDPNRFNYTSLQSPFGREIFKDEIAQQSAEDAANARAAAAQRREDEVRRREIQSQLQSEQDSAIKAEKDNEWNIANLESARTGRKYVEDPNRPGFPRPVLSTEEWMAETEAKKAEQSAEAIKKRRDETGTRATGYMSAYGDKVAALKNREEAMSDSDYEKARINAANSVLADKDYALQTKADEANKNIGLFKWGAKEQEAKKQLADVEAEREMLNTIRNDPDYVSKVLDENPDTPHLNPALKQEAEARSEIQRLDAKKNRVQGVINQWKGFDKDRPQMPDDEFEQWIEGSHEEDPYSSSLPLESSAQKVKDVEIDPNFERQIEAAKLAVKMQGISDALDVTKAEYEAKAAEATAQGQLVQGMMESAGTLRDGRQIYTSEIQAEAQKLNQLNADAAALAVKANGQVEAYNENVTVQGRMAEMNAANKAVDKPLTTEVVKLEPVPEDRMAMVAAAESELNSRRPQAYYGYGGVGGAVDIKSIQDVADYSKNESRKLAEIRAIANNPKAVSKITVNNAAIGWVEETTLPNGATGEVWKVYRDQLQSAMPSAAGRDIQIIERPDKYFDYTEKLLNVNAYDPDKEYETPIGQDPEVINAITERLQSALKGEQASELAADPKYNVTRDDVTKLLESNEQFNEKFDAAIKKSGVQDIATQVATGKLDPAEGQRLYEQKIKAIYGPEGIGEERMAIVKEVMRMRDAAFTGGANLSEVIDIARKVGISVEQPPDIRETIEASLKETGIYPLAADYADALADYQSANYFSVLYDPVKTQDIATEIASMMARESVLRNRLAEQIYGSITAPAYSPLGVSTRQIRQDINLSVEQEEELDKMVRQEAESNKWNPINAGSDAVQRFIVGATYGSFGLKGIVQLGHMLGVGAGNLLDTQYDPFTKQFYIGEDETFNRAARQPDSKFVEIGKELGIWTEDTIRRTAESIQGTYDEGSANLPDKINAIQFRDALEVYRQSSAFKLAPEEKKKQIALELLSLKEVIHQDIEGNPLYRAVSAFEEGVRNTTDPMNDRNYFTHLVTGGGSLAAFMLPQGFARAGMSAPNAAKSANFFRKAVPQEKLFGINSRIVPTAGTAVSKWYGMTGVQGSLMNLPEAFSRIEQVANQAAADPNLDYDQQVYGDYGIKTGILMTLYAMGGFSEGLNIVRGLNRLDFTKLPPTAKNKLLNVLQGTLEEFTQEGGLAFYNALTQEMVLPTPGAIMVDGEVAGYDTSIAFQERFAKRLQDEGIQILEEGAIGGVMGMVMSLIQNGMLGRRFKRARRQQEQFIGLATRASEAKISAMSGDNAAEAIHENMPKGSVQPTQVEIDEINAIYGGAERAAEPGAKSIALMRQEVASATARYGWDAAETQHAEMALAEALAYQGIDAGRRMGRQIEAVREHAEAINQIDADIEVAEKQFEQSQRGGSFVAADNAQKAVTSLRAERVRLQQAHIATKVAQGRGEYLSSSELEIVQKGDEEVGVGPATEEFEGVTVVRKEIIDWAAKNAPAQAALVEMSQEETIARIKDGRLGIAPTPELEAELPSPAQQFAEAKARDAELASISLDQDIDTLPDYDPRVLRRPAGRQTPGMTKLRQIGPTVVANVAAELANAYPNLPVDKINSISSMLIERLIRRVGIFDSAFRNIEVTIGEDIGSAAVTSTGNLRIDPEQIVRFAVRRLAEGASLKDAAAYVDAVVREEVNHNVVRFLLQNYGGDQYVAEIWDALSDNVKDTVRQSYFSYTYNKAMRDGGIDLSIIPIEAWPANYAADAERATNSAYMGHEYLNMVIEQAESGNVSISLLPPRNFWQKLLDILETLAEAIGLSLQDPSLDPEIRKRIEDIRDFSMLAIKQIEAGALNLFAETRAPDSVVSPKDRLDYLKEAGIPLMVASYYRETGLSPQDLIRAAEAGMRRAIQKGGENWIDQAIQGAQAEIEKNLSGELKLKPIRPNFIDKILGYTAKSEKEAWSLGENIREDIVKTLPTKQREVMTELMAGKSSKRIGKELGLNNNAVENIRKQAEATIQEELDKASKVRERLLAQQTATREEKLSEEPTSTASRSGAGLIKYSFPNDYFGPDLGTAQRKEKTASDFADPNSFYRVIVGDAAFDDIVKSGLVRTNAESKGGLTLGERIANRPTAFPSFSKGSASMDYAKANPNHYIVVTTDPSMQPSKSGRHSKGQTMFPTDADGRHLSALSAASVSVYKHLGEGRYELAIENGKVISATGNIPEPFKVSDVIYYESSGAPYSMMKKADWSRENESAKNELTWIEDPLMIKTFFDRDPNTVGALVVGVFRFGDGITGMEMLSWLRPKINGPIIVEDIIPDAEGFYQKAVERGLIDDYFPKAEQNFEQNEIRIQNAALRETPEEMAQIWSTSHPETKNPDGTPKAWYRGHFDDDLFSIPSRAASYLGPGVYFTSNLGDASQYADIKNHPDGAGDYIYETLVQAYEDEGLDHQKAAKRALRELQKNYTPRITPVYLHGQKWFRIMPYADDQPLWSFAIDWELDKYEYDTINEISDDYRDEYQESVEEEGDTRKFETWLKEEKSDEINERAQEMAWEMNYDPKETGEIAELFNAILEELRYNDSAEEFLLENSDYDVASLIAAIEEAKQTLSSDGETVMTMSDVAKNIFGLEPIEPRIRSSRYRAIIPNMGPGVGGFLLGLGLQKMGYDGIMMDATTYFPMMAEVDNEDTVHAMVFNAKPVYGMFGGTIRKQRDPLQWAAKRGGAERVKPIITSKKSDIVDVARGKIYSQDMGTVTVRELLQNSLDAIRPQIMKGQRPEDHKVTLFIDEGNRTIQVTDTGHGMPPEVMASAMVDITKTFKETDGAGGYGLAKAVIFGNSEDFEVETVYQENDGSWTKTVMTGNSQKWENTINEVSGGVKILTERNFNVGEGIEATPVALKNEWTEFKNKDLKGKQLPTGELFPKGISIKHDGYILRLEVSPQIIPTLPDVFRDPEAIEEMASIIANDEHPLNYDLNLWVRQWIGSDRQYDSVETIKTSVDEYRVHVEENLTSWVNEDSDFTSSVPIFDKTTELSDQTAFSNSFQRLLTQLPTPLQDLIYNHWVERFGDKTQDGYDETPVEIVEQWRGITLSARWARRNNYYDRTRGITAAQGIMETLGWTISWPVFEKAKQHLQEKVGSTVMVTEKPSTYTRVKSKIHSNIQFDFSESEKTFVFIGDNDTIGVEFEIGITKENQSIKDLSKRTENGKKSIRRIPNTSKDLEFIKQSNNTEANYKVYRSTELVDSDRVIIQILNRGIWQFEKIAQIDAQVRLPKKIVIDVHPNVSPKDEYYPFTAGRDDFHGHARWRVAEFYKDLESDARVSKNQMLKDRWEESPLMALLGGRKARVVDVSGKNTDLANEIANHKPSNEMFAKMLDAFQQIQKVLIDNGFPEADKGDMIAWNIGQDAVGVNYKSKVHVGGTDLSVMGDKEFAISIDPSVMFSRATKNAKYLGLEQFGTLERKIAADMVITAIHELTHNGGFGDSAASYSYQLTENIGRMAMKQLPIILELAADIAPILENTDLKEFLDRVDTQQNSNDDHDYAIFIQGTPTGRNGANKRLGRSVGSSLIEGGDTESLEVGGESDLGTARRESNFDESLPGLQAAASRESINRRLDAFGNTRDRAGRLIEVAANTKWPDGSGPNGGWNVLSLFDGIAAGRQALKNLGVPVDNYFGSEIEKQSIAIATHNHPDIQHLGDITKLSGNEVPQIDLIWGGSPCQGFSRAGKNKGMEDPRSKLFWEWVRLWKTTAARWFLLENVAMKPEDEAIITRALGVPPIRINGNLLTGANRDRLYWTNIPTTHPLDIGVQLKHVIQPQASMDLLWDRATIDRFMSASAPNGRPRWNNSQHSDVKRPKAMALIKSLGKGYPNNLLIDKQGQYRKYSMVEAARLMGFPDEYLQGAPGSNTKKYEGAGNSWAVPVIEHILQHVATAPKKLQFSAQRGDSDGISLTEYHIHAIKMAGSLVHKVKHDNGQTKWHVEVSSPSRKIIGMFNDPSTAETAQLIWSVMKDINVGDTVRSMDHGGRSFVVTSTSNFELKGADKLSGETGELSPSKVFRTRVSTLNAASRMEPWPLTFPEVQWHSTLSALKGKKGSEKSARHARAKAGDVDAALEIVMEVMKPEKALELASLYPGAVLATPNTRENDSTNAIPETMAAWISHLTGMPIEEKIHEISKANHTEANAWERLFRVPKYGGEIDPTKTYVIVDDVSTSGSTINALRSHIQSQGGTVVAAVAIASPNNPQNGPGWVLSPTSEALSHIDDYYRNGNQGGIDVVSDLLLKHGLSPLATLTNSQIWLLAGGKPNRKTPVRWSVEDLDRRLTAGKEAERNRQSETIAQGAPRRADNLWGQPNQKFTSKDTARGNSGGLPKGYTYLKSKGLIEPGYKVLDIGTGPYRYADAAIEEMGGVFYSYEPWWEERTEDTRRAIKEVVNGQADVVISNNVLNVIPEKTNQRRLILQAQAALKEGSKFYLTIYKAPKAGQVGDRDQYQAAEKLEYYRGMVETVFGKGNVTKDGDVLIATKRTLEQRAARRDMEEPKPVMFSKLSRLIEAKVGEKAGSQHVAGIIGQWQVHEPATIGNGKVRRRFPSTERDKADQFAKEIEGTVSWQGDVTAEELEWTGITDYLAANPKSVTKQGLLDFVKSSQPEVKEITLTGKKLGGYAGERAGVASYQEYSTPGGSNYRELLFIYEPIKGSNHKLFTKAHGSHWEAPNVMYHARVSDRFTPDGKKVLYVNEIQSDWHQKGQSKGYQGGDTAAEFWRLFQKAFPPSAMLFAEQEDITMLMEGKSIAPRQSPRPSKYLSEDENKRLHDLALIQASAGGIPYAPWADSWQQLAVKRMVQYASQIGDYDAIAFATGNHQIDLNEGPTRLRVKEIKTTKLPKEIRDNQIEKLSGEEAWLKSGANDIIAFEAGPSWQVRVKDNFQYSPVGLVSTSQRLRKSKEAWIIKPSSNPAIEEKIKKHNELWVRRSAEELTDFLAINARKFDPDPETGWARFDNAPEYRYKQLRTAAILIQVKNDFHGNSLIDNSKNPNDWVALPGRDLQGDANLIGVSGGINKSAQMTYLRQEIDQELKHSTSSLLTTRGRLKNWAEIEPIIWLDRLNSEGASALDGSSNLISVEIIPKNSDSKPFTLIVPSSGTIKRYGQDMRLDDIVLNFADAARNAPVGETQSFAGENLSIGGKMHRMVYDVMVPSALRKLGKRYGVKPNVEPILYRDPDQRQSAVEYLNQDDVVGAFDAEGQMIGAFDEGSTYFPSGNEAYESFYEQESPYQVRGEVPKPERRMDVDWNGETLKDYPVLDVVLMDLPSSLQDESIAGVPLFAARREESKWASDRPKGIERALIPTKPVKGEEAEEGEEGKAEPAPVFDFYSYVLPKTKTGDVKRNQEAIAQIDSLLGAVGKMDAPSEEDLSAMPEKERERRLVEIEKQQKQVLKQAAKVLPEIIPDPYDTGLVFDVSGIIDAAKKKKKTAIKRNKEWPASLGQEISQVSHGGAPGVFARLDSANEWLESNPEAIGTPSGYVEYMKRAGASALILSPPKMVETIVNRPQDYADYLTGGYHEDRTVAGTLKSAHEGLDWTLKMRDAIQAHGELPEWNALLHHFWGLLSRMMAPVDQEGMWLRLLAVPEFVEILQKSIDGTYRQWADEQWKMHRKRIEAATVGFRTAKKGAAPRAAVARDVFSEVVINARNLSEPTAGKIGNGATANAAALHAMMLAWDGKWGQVAKVYTDNQNSKDMGRAFWALGHGAVGIKNKVQRFIGLTYGIPGLIMDRWKFVEFWLPDLMAQAGVSKPSEYFKYGVSPSTRSIPSDRYGIYGSYGKVDASNEVFSLALYEGLETALQAAINNSTEIRALLGRHANVGGLHWIGWNAIKNEAVGHSSLDLSLDLLQSMKVGQKPDFRDVIKIVQSGTYFTESVNEESGTARRLTITRGVVSSSTGADPNSERGGGSGGTGRPGPDGGRREDVSGAGAPSASLPSTAQLPVVKEQGAAKRDVMSAATERPVSKETYKPSPYDPVNKQFSPEIDFATPRRIQAITAMMERVDKLYETGNIKDAERLDAELEEALESLESMMSEYEEVSGEELQGELDLEKTDNTDGQIDAIDSARSAYRDYKEGNGESRGIISDADFAKLVRDDILWDVRAWLRDNPEAIPIRKDLSDAEILEAFEDDFQARERLIERSREKREEIVEKNLELYAAKRDDGDLDAEGAEAARFLSEEVEDLADFIKHLEARKKQKKGKVTKGVPRLANISGDEKIRAAHSIVQWSYDREREKLAEPDMMAAGRKQADNNPQGVESAILEAGANRTGLGSPELVYAAKIVISRAWRDASASGKPEAMRRAQILSHAYQRTRTEVARELAAGRDPAKTPAERHAEMIASFMGFGEHTTVEDERIRDLARSGARRDRIREIHKLISTAKSPEDANRYKNELKVLKEAIKAAEVDAELQQKRIETAVNVIGTYGVTLRDIFDGDRVRAARQAPAVKAAIARMKSDVGKNAAKMILNRQPNNKIGKKLGITEEKIRKFEEDFRKALRLEFGKAAQRMAQRAEEESFDDLVLVDENIRNRNKFHGDESGQFDVARPEHAMWAARTLASVFNGNTYNAINEFWINAILSGPQTQAVNVFSNALNATWDKTIQAGLESIVNQIVLGDKTQAAQFGDIKRWWKGMAKGIAPAWRNAVASFKNDGLDFFEAWAMQEPVTKFDASKVESAHLPSIKGVKGKIIRTPGNALQAMDALFKTSIASGEVAVQAFRIANAQIAVGDIKPEQLDDRIAELMEHGSPAWILAIEKAKELTFTKEFDVKSKFAPERWMTVVQNVRSGRIRGAEESMLRLGLSFLFPFIRTPYRILEVGTRKTTIGTANLIIKIMQSGIAVYKSDGRLSFNAEYGNRGRSELIRDITEQAIAWFITAILFGAAEGDDDDEEKPLLIIGTRPYDSLGHGSRELTDRLYGASTVIRIGGRNGVHIEYGRYEPISTVLSTTVDLIRRWKDEKNTEGQTFLSSLAGSIANQAQDKTFLQGVRTLADLSEMITAMQNQDSDKVSDMIDKSIKGFLRGFVPNFIRQPLRELDPIPRDRSGYLYSLTGAGMFGLPKHDLYGRNLEKTLVPPARLLVRAANKAEALHPGDEFLSALAVARPDLAKSFPTSWGGSTTNTFKLPNGERQKMDDNERNAFSKLAGQKFSLKVTQWIDPFKIRMPTEEHLEEFKSLLGDARSEAREQLFVNGRYVGATR